MPYYKTGGTNVENNIKNKLLKNYIAAVLIHY